MGASSTARVWTSPVTPPLTVLTVVDPGYGLRIASPPKSRIDACGASRGASAWIDLRVSHELQRHEPQGACHVVRRDAVLVALHRPEDEPVDGADRLQRGCDELGRGEIEGARLDRMLPRDRRGGGAAALLVAARDHDCVAARGVGLGEPQPDTGRPSDDHGGSSVHAVTIERRTVRVNSLAAPNIAVSCGFAGSVGCPPAHEMVRLARAS